MKRLPSFTILFLLLAISLLFIITCKKEYSYEGNGKAVYSFVGAPNICTSAEVSGSYIAGTPVDSSNGALLYVIVTTAGSAEISTETVDGISFSTGQHTLTKSSPSNYGIILYCHGTPTAIGTFTFHISGTTGCSFSVVVTDQPDAVYTLSGAPGDCGNPVQQGVYKWGTAMESSNLITIDAEVTSKGPYSITTDVANGFSFSATGTFTSTGAQTVVLQAKGTPIVPELTQFHLQGASSACVFYVPVANADPVATYVLQSGVQNGQPYCAPGSVQGIYTSGTQLSSGNTLTVNAYVTVPGNFTISTTEIDGVKFSYNGVFLTTGAQDVILKGTGTPIRPGTFSFYPQIVGPAPIGGSTCGLDVVVQ